MSLQKAVANALSFAHLAGISRTKGARAESDDKKDKDDDKNEAKAEDDADEAKAEGDDKPKDGDGDEDDAKAEKDDADDKEDDKDAKASAYQAGYAAANKRAASVFSSEAAGRNVALAAELVFNTSMSAQQIVNTLALAGSAKGAGLAQRMAGVKAPVVKADAEASAQAEGPAAAAQATVAAILKAAAKARGEKA